MRNLAGSDGQPALDGGGAARIFGQPIRSAVVLRYRPSENDPCRHFIIPLLLIISR